MTQRPVTKVRSSAGGRPAARRTALALAGLSLAGLLSGCADSSQSGDSQTDTQTDEVPVPGEPSESPS